MPQFELFTPGDDDEVLDFLGDHLAQVADDDLIELGSMQALSSRVLRSFETHPDFITLGPIDGLRYDKLIADQRVVSISIEMEIERHDFPSTDDDGNVTRLF